MNIEEYRAMKAEQERAKTDAQVQRTDTATTKTEQTSDGSVSTTANETDQPSGTSQTQDASTEKVVDPVKPQIIEIDGKEVSIDELKSGYLRQSDYTRKTQDAKRKEQQAEQGLKLLEQLQSNPELAQELSGKIDAPYLDPQKAQFKELEDKYYDLYIQNEMRSLHDKYGDFKEDEVLNIAMNERIENLDTAFHVMKSRKGGGEDKTTQLNLDDIKTQLRQEILADLKSQQDANVDTGTIIQAGGDTSPVHNSTPQLSSQELKVARMMGMETTEYAKWRDITKKKN